MGNSSLQRKQLESCEGRGDKPEDACRNLEENLLGIRQSVIVTIGPENLAPIIASPRANAVNRVCLATIDGKQYKVKITKENKINNVEYIATIKV